LVKILLWHLAEGLVTVKAALVELSRSDSTLVATYAEFGRGAAENNSNGIDHGTANAHFVLRGKARSGLHGQAPQLNQLENGKLAFAVDFRSIHATALEKWWGVGSGNALGRRCGTLDVRAPELVGRKAAWTLALGLSLGCFTPPPCLLSSVIKHALEGQRMRTIHACMIAIGSSFLAVAPFASGQSVDATRCFDCHAVDRKKIGPSFMDIASRYRSNPGALQTVADHIRNGSRGIWGAIPAPPSRVTPEEAIALARWAIAGGTGTPDFASTERASSTTASPPVPVATPPIANSAAPNSPRYQPPPDSGSSSPAGQGSSLLRAGYTSVFKRAHGGGEFTPRISFTAGESEAELRRNAEEMARIFAIKGASETAGVSSVRIGTICRGPGYVVEARINFLVNRNIESAWIGGCFNGSPDQFAAQIQQRKDEAARGIGISESTDYAFYYLIFGHVDSGKYDSASEYAAKAPQGTMVNAPGAHFLLGKRYTAECTNIMNRDKRISDMNGCVREAIGSLRSRLGLP
jgi:cytochrome c551/c552